LLKNHTIKPNKNFTSTTTYVVIIVEVKAMLVNKGRGYVYYLRYHIVFCTKYRHKIIEGQIETRLKEMFQSLVRVHKFEIVTTETIPDYVHLLVDCTPQHYIPDILKALKGNTARFLLKEFPELRKKNLGRAYLEPFLLCGQHQRKHRRSS